MKSFWKNKKVFITGHTGFKGSWMTQILLKLGASVHAYSLAPTVENSHYDELGLQKNISEDIEDIRNYPALETAIKKFQPDIVFHLAAQPLVRYSYKNPLETYETNVMGTANVMNACRDIENLGSLVVITTDKCYENKEWIWPYRETDRLGGYDPYSNSKACTELVVDSFTKSFFANTKTGVASARAGNVIGGGDWSEDRLLPDIVRSFLKKEKVVVRSPKAVRPWQHVLEPLAGYLLLAEKIFEKPQFNGGYNFGPSTSETVRVIDILNMTKEILGEEFQFEIQEDDNLHEAGLLTLDSSKANKELQWNPKWDSKMAVAKTLEWYNKQANKSDETTKITDAQIEEYFQLSSL